MLKHLLTYPVACQTGQLAQSVAGYGSPSLALEGALPEDAAFVASVIVAVTEGMLERIFNPVAQSLGFVSVSECIAWLFADGQGIFNLEQVQLLRLKNSPDLTAVNDAATVATEAAAVKTAMPDDIIGLCFAYPLYLHQDLIPDLMEKFISPQDIALLRQIMPQSAAGAEAAICKQQALYLNTLWVRTDCRSLGLGRLLIDVLKEKAAAFNCNSIVLHCFNDNQVALSFYQRLGFVQQIKLSYPPAIQEKHRTGGSILALQLKGGQE